MTKLDLIKKAIDFAMTDLCGSHLDMPCGCDGCPYGNVRRDDDGNPDCSLLASTMTNLRSNE